MKELLIQKVKKSENYILVSAQHSFEITSSWLSLIRNILFSRNNKSFKHSIKGRICEVIFREKEYEKDNKNKSKKGEKKEHVQRWKWGTLNNGTKSSVASKCMAFISFLAVPPWH